MKDAVTLGFGFPVIATACMPPQAGHLCAARCGDRPVAPRLKQSISYFKD